MTEDDKQIGSVIASTALISGADTYSLPLFVLLLIIAQLMLWILSDPNSLLLASSLFISYCSVIFALAS
jgi:hypothetical protein